MSVQLYYPHKNKNKRRGVGGGREGVNYITECPLYPIPIFGSLLSTFKDGAKEASVHYFGI